MSEEFQTLIYIISVTEALRIVEAFKSVVAPPLHKKDTLSGSRQIFVVRENDW